MTRESPKLVKIGSTPITVTILRWCQIGMKRIVYPYHAGSNPVQRAMRLSSNDRKSVSLTESAGLIPASLTNFMGMSASGRRSGFQSQNPSSILGVPTKFGSET